MQIKKPGSAIRDFLVQTEDENDKDGSNKMEYHFVCDIRNRVA